MPQRKPESLLSIKRLSGYFNQWDSYRSLSIAFMCSLRIRLIYCERERSSASANSRSFFRMSLSIVILIFSFKGFI